METTFNNPQSIFSHELRTPVTTIFGMVHFLKKSLVFSPLIRCTGDTDDYSFTLYVTQRLVFPGTQFPIEQFFCPLVSVLCVA